MILGPDGRPVQSTQSVRRSGGGYGSGFGLMHGGIRNPNSGMGLASDKSESSYFTPTRVHWRGELEVLRVQSWAARKFIEIPIDDMFIRWRQWEAGENEAAADAMMEAEKRHGARMRLARAMKAGRLYGTGLLVMVTREAPLDMPLVPERVRPGDLLALQVFDRYDCSVWKRDYDLYSPTYGMPLEYRLTPTWGNVPLPVHASRVLRFDGITSLSSDGWTIYDRDWGVSEIVPAILAIMQDSTVATGAAHLTQEASIPTLTTNASRDAGVAGHDPNEETFAAIGEEINQMKSIYRLLMLDQSEKFERTTVSWAGLPDIMDRFARRLAAAASIPATRFWGTSPVGLNATGESDMANYAQHVRAMQEYLLPDALDRLDMVLARDAGLREPPEYSFIPLDDANPETEATTAKTKAEAFGIAIDKGAIDEDEMREGLDGDPVFGDLAGEAPGLPDPILPPMSGGPPGGGPPKGA